ncbi:MAG: hypothetical protein JXA94_07585 [Parachlamydiales bacterium]|nr:hypothetical protein [Parachlamydiales bacterium]
MTTFLGRIKSILNLAPQKPGYECLSDKDWQRDFTTYQADRLPWKGEETIADHIAQAAFSTPSYDPMSISPKGSPMSISPYRSNEGVVDQKTEQLALQAIQQKRETLRFQQSHSPPVQAATCHQPHQRFNSLDPKLPPSSPKETVAAVPFIWNPFDDPLEDEESFQPPLADQDPRLKSTEEDDCEMESEGLQESEAPSMPDPSFDPAITPEVYRKMTWTEYNQMQLSIKARTSTVARLNYIESPIEKTKEQIEAQNVCIFAKCFLNSIKYQSDELKSYNSNFKKLTKILLNNKTTLLQKKEKIELWFYENSEIAKKVKFLQMEPLSCPEVNYLTAVPNAIRFLQDCEFFKLNSSSCKDLSKISLLTKLETLKISGQKIEILCDFSKFTKLAKLKISNLDELVEIPQEINNLHSLISLTINNCFNLTKVPAFSLVNLRNLTITNNANFKTFMYDNLPTISLLNLSNNSLVDLPLDLSCLTTLLYLNISGNRFTVIPDCILFIVGASNINELVLGLENRGAILKNPYEIDKLNKELTFLKKIAKEKFEEEGKRISIG